MNVAIDMADKFLEKGVIVSTRGRDKTQNYVYRARKKGTYPNFPLIILVNNGSASASEIVAGAIKGPQTGRVAGHQDVWQGFRAEPHSRRRRQGCIKADHGKVLYAFRGVHP